MGSVTVNAGWSNGPAISEEEDKQRRVERTTRSVNWLMTKRNKVDQESSFRKIASRKSVETCISHWGLLSLECHKEGQ